MARFGVGVMHNTINSRFGPKPLVHADYAAVHAAVCATAGIEPEGERALHVWTLIHEIPEGNWAGGGKVIY
jgi:hypothetical protein